MNVTLIERRSGEKTGWKIEEEEVEVEFDCSTEDEMFALFFRNYVNRLKYINDLSYKFKKESLNRKYKEWISDINNYASNGGDMW